MWTLEQAPALRVIRAELGPGFANEQQRAFFAARRAEVLYSGAFRAGKSRIGCEKAYALALRHPGIPIGVFRKTAASLAASTERTLLHDVVPRGDDRAQQPHRALVRAGERLAHLAVRPRPRPDHGAALQGGLRRARLGVRRRGGRVHRVRLGDGQGPPLVARHRLPPDRRRHEPGQPAPLAQAPLHAGHRRPRLPPRQHVRQPDAARRLPRRAPPRAPTTSSAAATSWASGWAPRASSGSCPTSRSSRRPSPPFKRVVAGVDWGFVHAFACEVVGQSGSGPPVRGARGLRPRRAGARHHPRAPGGRPRPTRASCSAPTPASPPTSPSAAPPGCAWRPPTTTWTRASRP